MPSVNPDRLRRIAAEVLRRLGTPDETADVVAGSLVEAELSGYPSHGVMRLNDYAARIRRGDLVPTGQPRIIRGGASDPVVLIDGQSGYGHLAASELVRIMVASVAAHSVAVGGIVNASHTGRLGEWAELAANQGVIFMMGSASLSRGNVAAFGAGEARLGTNPIAVGVPAADGDSFVLDFATSEISGGKLDHLIETSNPAPPHSLLDRDGNPTEDARAWRDGGMLLTFGGHKGYAFSLLIALLGGCVVGQADPDNPRHGVWAVAFDPGLFADRDHVLQAIRTQLQRMRSTKPRKGFDRVEVPGDFERRTRAQHAASVPISDASWQRIIALGESLGLRRDFFGSEADR